MANVVNLENKLLGLIDTEASFAIALTGEWGVGKTYFWKYFKQKNINQFKLQKYAYVSLFGIDSLDSLKYEIAVKTHAINQLEDRLQGAKSLFNKALDNVDFSKIQGKGLSLNIGKSLITSALSSLISKTVICIDDIERISDNVPIKEVMGLINELKLEKDCQIIVILHEAKATEQFQEYKEKVFDEVLILDDNSDILKTFITDELVLDIMQLFYNTLKVRNLRFYSKVFKNYQQISNSIKLLSETSKEHILRNLLVIRWIDEFEPKIYLDDNRTFKVTLDLFLDENNDFIKISDDRFLMKNEEIKAFRNYLEPFYPSFSFDGWAKNIVNMLITHDVTKEPIQNLLNKDLLSEKSLQNEVIHEKVIHEFHSMQIQPNFCERLYYSACAKIQKSELNNISFYCDIFENSNRRDLSQQLESHVEQFIKREIKLSQSKPSVSSWYRFGIEPYDRFEGSIVKAIENYQPINNSNPNFISSIFLRYYEDSITNDTNRSTLTSIDKDILKKVIWTEIEEEIYRKQFIHSILLHPVLNEIKGKREKVRKWILELLEEAMIEDPNIEAPIKMWLNNTKNLTENLT